MARKPFYVKSIALSLLLFFVMGAGGFVFAANPSSGASCADHREGAAACHLNGCYLCSSGVWVSKPLFMGTSASAVSPSRSNDVTTGLFSATASTISIATAGTERLTVTATGSVGIGTTTPDAKFQVGNSVSSNGFTQVARIAGAVGSSGTITDFLHLDANPETAYDQGMSISFGHKSTTYGEYTSRIIHYGYSNNVRSSKLQFQTHSSTAGVWNTGILIDNVGNVGIGTTAPAAKLEVASGEVKVGTSGAACSSANAGAIRWSGSSFLGCNGSSWVSLGGGGTIDFDAPTTLTTGTNYLASSAGIVVARATADTIGNNCVLAGYTDSTSTPTTMLVRSTDTYQGYVSITFPVRGTHYYRFTNSNCGSIVAYFYPLTFS